eukprot:4283352-Pyramimonas_sp.AAC.1
MHGVISNIHTKYHNVGGEGVNQNVHVPLDAPLTTMPREQMEDMHDRAKGKKARTKGSGRGGGRGRDSFH